MSGKTFVDSNVLIYAHDLKATAKQPIAKALLSELWNEGVGALSVQVLQEFYVNVTRKVARPLSKDSARRVVHAYHVWCVDTSPADVTNAFRIEDEAQIGFWDALIVASALKCGAMRIVSEDLNAGQRISGISIVNPFSGIV
jgi:predicted nucleic acid-binding protein